MCIILYGATSVTLLPSYIFYKEKGMLSSLIKEIRGILSIFTWVSIHVLSHIKSKIKNLFVEGSVKVGGEGKAGGKKFVLKCFQLCNTRRCASTFYFSSAFLFLLKVKMTRKTFLLTVFLFLTFCM